MKKTYYLLCVLVVFVSCMKDQEKLFKQIPSDLSGIKFNNLIVETDSVNILTEEYIFNGGGVAVGDFDNDGLPDLFFTGNQVTNKLYLNKGDFVFDEVSFESGIEAVNKWCTGVTVVDINADGLSDIYVSVAMSNDDKNRANLLFVNQGLDEKKVPTFKEMATEYGIAESGNSMWATFFDYDKDGFLDLYVLNNEQVQSMPTNYRPKVVDGSAISNDRLYHNNGDGTFSDVTLEAGIVIEGFGLGIAVSDINYDGWPDIHISNDYQTNDLLYINNGDGTFSNDIKNYIRHQSKFSMGSDISDYNNDGFLDLVTLDMLGETNYRMKTTIGNNNYINNILNKRYDYEPQYSRNMLHQGNGVGVPFSEIGLMAGMSKTDWSWSPLFMDVDNDGYKDLLITNGFPRDITDKDFGDFRIGMAPFLSPHKILDSIPTVKIPNYGFKNNGNGMFEDMSDSWGLNAPSFSNGAAFVDLDKDGDLDYVVNNINEEAFIFRNTQREQNLTNGFINVKLNGPKHNEMGIGVKLALKYGENEVQYYEHYLTRGYMSSVDEIAHFGLGLHVNIESIEILWPDGKFQKLENIETNQTLLLAHKDAKLIDISALPFPFVQKETTQMFTEISKEIGVDLIHQEKDIVDYSMQRILPHKLSQNGPCIAVGDIDGNQYEDFIIGSSSTFSPVIYFQKADGTFSKKLLFETVIDKKYEEESMVLFDLDNDGDLDLYLVSGSNEFINEDNLYVDRLMTNDGEGNFTFAMDKMPIVKASGSVVKAQDFDNDGFVDLFVGGRTPVAQFPMPDKSFLLKNNGGKLEDVTEILAPGLANIGMVTDAVWTDVNNDDLQDLVVVGEFMAITIYENRKTSFSKLESSGLENYLGWWESVISEDFDNDGDFDFLVGNMGANNFYQPTEEQPVTLLAKDYDDNGSIDPVMFTYLKNEEGDFESFPVNFWGDLFGQSPLFRAKFNLYKEYASTTQKDLLNKEELEGATKLIGNYDKTSFIENLGNGKFKLKALPVNAQQAPINGAIVLDVDNDNNLDVLLVGNDYGNETFIGNYDAFNGLLLKGNGKGAFNSIDAKESGFVVSGDAKAIAKVKSAVGGMLYVVTQNRDEILVYKKK
ncbi:MAG: hypothetical protein COA50_03460 [Flavobacteriaceae bacterium]|nr:MAG: hypothetical protein COA50_03460 [Flavobacteriaceae bacterium]